LKISKIAFVTACVLALSLGAWGPRSNVGTAAATAPITGKFVVNFSITVASSIPSADTIGCEVTADVEGITETAAVAATRTAATAKCLVTIPYSWILVSPTTDEIELQYDITNDNSALGVPSALPIRISHHPIAALKVPANGAVTTETVTATF
jgi:hypothetical protein